MRFLPTARPDFLVIGAGRAGTTSLHHYLRQHPGVFVPSVKAPSHYYCLAEGPATSPTRRRETRAHFVCDPAAYARLFSAAAADQVRGEVSPVYLASVRVPAHVAAANADMRLVVILRDPAERVQARFVARHRDGLERRRSLGEVVDDEWYGPRWPADTAGTYLPSGFVSHVLEAYLEVFPRRQLLVVTLDDLAGAPGAVMSEVLGFVGADPGVAIDTTVARNPSGGSVRNPVARVLWTRSASLRTAVRPLVPERWRDAVFRRVVDPQVAAPDHDALGRLREYYAEEVRRLSAVVGRDLTAWSSPPEVTEA